MVIFLSKLSLNSKFTYLYVNDIVQINKIMRLGSIFRSHSDKMIADPVIKSSAQLCKQSLEKAKKQFQSTHNNWRPQTTKSICGPFDSQFKKKFIGNNNNKFATIRTKILKSISQDAVLSKLQLPPGANIIPKFKQVQKMVKKQNRKLDRVSKKYQSVSDLQIYMTKKLMNNESTQQIISRIGSSVKNQYEGRQVVNQIYMRMTAPQLFKTKDQQGYVNNNEQQSSAQKMMSRTGFSKARPGKQTDRQLMERFDNFMSNKLSLSSNRKKRQFYDDEEKQEQLVQQIKTDKRIVTGIARKMIQDYRRADSDFQEQYTKNHQRQQSLTGSLNPQKNIGWIISECRKFEQRYSPKRKSAILNPRLQGKKFIKNEA